MAGKRSSTKKPLKRATPGLDDASAAHQFGVVLERVEAQLRVVAEGLTAHRDEFKRGLQELKQELGLRIEALELAVRKNSEDIRKNSEDIRKNSQDILELQRAIDALTEEVRGCARRVDLVALESRVARLEQRVGLAPQP